MKTIGVLSDTHLLRSDDDTRLRNLINVHFAEADMIVHAGDITDIAIFDDLAAGKPFVCVSGNMDSAATKMETHPKRVFQVEDVRIGLIHGDGFGGDLPEALLSVFENVDVIIFGHTHRPLCQRRGDVLMLNPGSALHPRGGPKGSVALLRVDGRNVDAKIIEVV